jgi:IS1 family transposase
VYRLSRERQVAVTHLLCEGNSLRSVERLTGIHRDTAMRLMVRVGRACQHLLDRRMRNLCLEHIQCDEIWTFVRRKQARLTADEQADDGIGDQFLFVALDERTKLIPAYLLGKRTSENTHDFMRQVAWRIRGFGPADPDNPLRAIPMTDLTGVADEAPPRISTDGWAPYPAAVEGAFSGLAEHGVLIKDYRQSEQPGRYGPPELAGALRRPLSKDLDPFDICTSHVERNNLTIRTFMRRFTRLALGFSKKLPNLQAAVALYVAHYNFCRWHGTLRRTPAMRAGLTGHPWTVAELMDEAGV